jgi:hypothetical protein
MVRKIKSECAVNMGKRKAELLSNGLENPYLSLHPLDLETTLGCGGLALARPLIPR